MDDADLQARQRLECVQVKNFEVLTSTEEAAGWKRSVVREALPQAQDSCI